METENTPEVPETTPESAPDGDVDTSHPADDAGADADSAAGDSSTVPPEAEEPAAESEPPPPKRPRGRPRKDGLPAGSPEARAKDTGVVDETGSGGKAPELAEKAKAAVAVAQKPRRERARPMAPPKQQIQTSVCTDPNCTAKHPSRGGKRGVQCVETGREIVAPMSNEDAAKIVQGVLKAIGFLISLFGGHPVSEPSAIEVGLATGPTKRVLWRMGIGDGNIIMDAFLIALALGMYTSGRVAEVRDARNRANVPHVALG